MRFIDREQELGVLERARERAERKLYTLAIYGLRRVGKTRLIREFMRENDIYFFVNRGKSSNTLLREYSGILKEKGILGKRESVETWDDLFDVIFERFSGVVAFDEFQDFRFVEASVYSTLQRFIDENEEKKGLLIIFTGSTVGMMERLFKDSREPLYGRVKREINLTPLPIRGAYEMAGELDLRTIDDFLTLYAVFGGFPRYWVSIEDEGLEGSRAAEVIRELLFSYSAPLEEEVLRILSLEFGKRSGVYYDILEAIANGATSPTKIAGYLNRKETSITRHLKELIDYFKIVGRDKNILGRGSTLYIKHPLMSFWFRFVHPKLSEYEVNREKLWTEVEGELPGYVGKKFDFICRELLVEMRRTGLLPFEFASIGRTWGRYREDGKRKVFEIDIAAVDSSRREALFGECKWRNKPVNARKILEDLKKKVELTGWRGKRYYMIIAKKLKNVPENVIALDEENIQNLLEGAL